MQAIDDNAISQAFAPFQKYLSCQNELARNSDS